MPGLNIKNEHTVQLVRELAELKGISLVAAVTQAVQDNLAKERSALNDVANVPRTSRYDRLMAFADEFSRRVPNPTHSWEIDGLLYGEDGLPK